MLVSLTTWACTYVPTYLGKYVHLLGTSPTLKLLPAGPGGSGTSRSEAGRDGVPIYPLRIDRPGTLLAVFEVPI